MDNFSGIFDGHNDTLTKCFELGPQGLEQFVKGSACQFDLAGAGIGQFKGGFFAICTPPPPDSPEKNLLFGLTITPGGYDIKPKQPLEQSWADTYTKSVLTFAQNLQQESRCNASFARSHSDIQQCMIENRIAMVLAMEGAEAIRPDLSNLEDYYRLGIRMISPVWSRPNAFGEGVPFAYPRDPDTGPGLTSPGIELISECNKIGIMIDLAHLNLAGFKDVAKFSNAPLLVSHCGVHKLCPSTRNITDWQIDAVGESGGVIGIYFEPANLDFRFTKENIPDNNVPLTKIIEHLDYVANRIGIDHVALGSDFDGADMPNELKDVSGLGKLMACMKEHGWNENEIEKICSGNWLRVIRQVCG